MIDFSFAEERLQAVRCRTPDEVRLLLREISEQLDASVQSLIEWYATSGYEELGDEISFRIHIYPDGCVSWGWDSYIYYEEAGYKVHEFSELYHITC